MPTYQYACTACGEQLEVVQSFSDAALTECPACAGQLRKVFSAVGIVFKGSGFYRTDSRSNGSKGSTDSSPAKESTGGSSESTAAKSEASSTPSTPAPASSPAPKSTPAAV